MSVAFKIEDLTAEELVFLQSFKENARAKFPDADLPDNVLAMVMFARKLEMERCMILLEKNLEWQKQFDIANADPKNVKDVLDSGVFGFGGVGSRVQYIFFPRINPEHGGNMKLMMQLSWLALLRSLTVEVMREGVIYVEDFHGATLGLMMKIMNGGGEEGKKDAKMRMDAMQDAMPLRIRKVVLCRCPWWIRIPMKMMRPFMKPKLRRKFVIATEVTELPAHVGGPQNLPIELGGTLDLGQHSGADRLFPELYATAM